ncbi:hypothetical protein DYD21_15160 [Rhodohalobacter sp. SW132]|uniref:hypothetical protein n=1 Tax=Rhodohalobacter sp. SW132 TaxID=2293433 RepID=UPI000E27BEA9|nr:hypothetical protein [Rhodohalobacter sp. SW132]REL29188.1 hypothetical protein DYD21_15160 [Rhodohalobacter sp. SW132]
MLHAERWNTLLILIISAIFFSCESVLDSGEDTLPIDWENGQSIAEAEDGHLTAGERQEWYKSAVELALRDVNSADSTEVEIPDGLVDLYYNALVHVVNSGLDEANRVTNEFEIRARPRMKHGEIIVMPDKEGASDWLQAWREGETETGNAAVDELIQKYDLVLESYSETETNSYGTAILATEKLLNPVAMAMDFEKIEEIINSESNNIAGDGNDILAGIEETFISFRYKKKWGDCPAGCIHTRYFEFHINAFGNVQFIDEGGDDFNEDGVQ